jgi:SynChlorMet cassette protein ScmD
MFPKTLPRHTYCNLCQKESTALKNGDKPITNPYVMLREEFDDWAVLFNPDAPLGFGGFGLNPTGIFLWKLLDGEHTLDDLVREVQSHAADVPDDVNDHIRVFADALIAEGLASYGSIAPRKGNFSRAPSAEEKAEPFIYQPPRLVNLSSGQAALGVCGSQGSHGGSCGSGAGAITCCNTPAPAVRVAMLERQTRLITNATRSGAVLRVKPPAAPEHATESRVVGTAQTAPAPALAARRVEVRAYAVDATQGLTTTCQRTEHRAPESNAKLCHNIGYPYQSQLYT